MSDTLEETVYTVARDGRAISSYVGSQESADVDRARIEGAMRAAMLVPDVYLATVTKTTTYSDPAPCDQ